LIRREPIDLAGKTVAPGFVVGIVHARIPIPVRQRERRIADQAPENRLVEIEIGAVPGEEPPAAMDLHAVEAIGRAAAIPAMNRALPIPAARIIVLGDLGERGIGGLEARDFVGVEFEHALAHPHRAAVSRKQGGLAERRRRDAFDRDGRRRRTGLRPGFPSGDAAKRRTRHQRSGEKLTPRNENGDLVPDFFGASANTHGILPLRYPFKPYFISICLLGAPIKMLQFCPILAILQACRSNKELTPYTGALSTVK
jgi:hypothetical protein